MALNEHVHVRTSDALGGADRAVTVSEQQRLEVDNFLA